MAVDAQEWGTAKDLSARWKIPVKTIYQYTAEEDGIPVVRIGRHFRYPLAECEAWLKARRAVRRGGAA